MAGRQAEGNVDLKTSLVTVSFDPEAFDVAIRSQGVKLIHWRAMKCPVGLTDKWDVRRTEPDHSGCSNGHIYTKAGEVTCLFVGNNNKQDQYDTGLMDGSTVQVTAPYTYDGCDAPVDVLPFDRFYLDEENITVTHSQLVEASIHGRDRLDFPVVNIIDVIDSDGKRHDPGECSVDAGQVVWAKPLPYNIEAEKGMIYAVRFTYRPFWYVKNLMHQVRVAGVETIDGRGVRRFPQQWQMQREYIFEKVDRNPDAPDSGDQRTVKAPRQMPFGPR